MNILNHRFIKHGRPGQWYDGAPTADELKIAADRGAVVQYGYSGPESTPKLSADKYGNAKWSALQFTINGCPRTVCYGLNEHGSMEARIFGESAALELTQELMSAIKADISKGGCKE